jgi:acyl-CoA synthetase (NDP forming)
MGGFEMKEILAKNIKDGYLILPELEAHKVCDAYGIKCPPTRFVTNKEQCIEEGNKIGYPVVIKIFSKQIIHKSDAGGVVVGIMDAEHLAEAYDNMLATVKGKYLDAAIEGVFVQKMMGKGIETIIGGFKDPQFGPVIMFGMGGIYVEIFKDTSFRLAPVDKEEARRQIEQTKVYKILQGVRGEQPCDIDALAEAVVNAANLLVSYDEIKEIDLNPVICYTNGCVAVDSRIVLDAVE